MSSTHLPYRPALLQTGVAHGPVLVLGNSLGTDTRLWAAQRRVLGAHYRVVGFDHPGHAGEALAQADSLADLAQGVLASLAAAGVTRFAYGGVSMGAALGMELALAAPDRVAALVLANTAAQFGAASFWEARVAKAQAEGMAALAEATVARWLTPAHAARDPALVAHLQAMFAGTDVDGYGQCCRALMRFDAGQRLASISVPTLVIAGTHDKATSVEQAQALHHGIPGSLYVALPTAHLANVGEPQAFTALIDSHLRRHV